MVNANTPLGPTPKKMLHQARDKFRVKHYSINIETQYVHWMKYFILCS
jgi:hypothetical protein